MLTQQSYKQDPFKITCRISSHPVSHLSQATATGNNYDAFALCLHLIASELRIYINLSLKSSPPHSVASFLVFSCRSVVHLHSCSHCIKSATTDMPSSPSPYVTLISSDGFEFIVRRESAYVAGPIKKMLDPTSQFPFPEMIGTGIVRQRRP